MLHFHLLTFETVRKHFCYSVTSKILAVLSVHQLFKYSIAEVILVEVL
jgi:hypothetical protein